MFKKGEYVIHETAGVCKVADVNTVDMKGVDDTKQFYYLEPVGRGNKLYIPVENHSSFMRNLITQDEARDLLSHVPDAGELPLPDYRKREEQYKAALKSCDCKQWMKIINTLYRKKLERGAAGKKLPSMETEYLRVAEQCLYTELSLSLDTTVSQIESEVSGQIEKQDGAVE